MRAFEFLSEMAALKNKSDDKYLVAVNDMLEKGVDIEIDDQGGRFLKPNPGQQVNSRSDVITGTIDGAEAKVKVNQVFKDERMKAFLSGAEVGSKIQNKGEVAEGLLGCATLAKLISRTGKDIEVKDVINIIGQLKGGRTSGTVTKTVDEVESNITDKFILSVSLKVNAYKDFTDIEKVKGLMADELQSIVDYTNDSVNRYSSFFSKNGRPDVVEIISDGVSNETGSKTDVQMIYNDKNGKRVVKHFDLSVKTGDVGQFGQMGGGSQEDSLETRFQFVQSMWQEFGVNIEPVKQGFIGSDDITEAYGKAYSYASSTLADMLKGQNQQKESEVLKNLIDGIKHFATLKDDRVKLVQFTKKGYYVLDFKKLTKLYNNKDIDLSTKYEVGRSGLPKVVIFNAIDGKEFFQIRMYRAETGYVRNYIEKKPLMKDITKVRGNV